MGVEPPNGTQYLQCHGDVLVKVCTKDDDTNIARTEFKTVRLTDKQTKSGKPCGFTNGKANVGFPVEGTHEY